jgi:hypothetical protein
MDTLLAALLRYLLGRNSAITRELLSLYFHLSGFKGAGNRDESANDAAMWTCHRAR